MRIRWLLLVPCLLIGASSLNAATVYVDGRRPATGADSKSWTTAFPTVTSALSRAKYTDDIWVAAGVYDLNVRITNGVRLFGGFVGTETYLDQRPGLPGLTTLLGHMGRGVTLYLFESQPGTVIDGFTISAPISSSTGVIQVANGTPTISHNIITQSPNLTDTLSAPVPARGLIECLGGTPTIVNNIIVGGGANGIAFAQAGGVAVNNTIVGNAAAGIVVASGAPPLLVNNIIAMNQYGISTPKGVAPVMRGNCVYGNVAGDYDHLPDQTGSDGNISADPRLAFLEDGNLHIQPDSPCVDAGLEDVDHGDLDIDLLPRVMGARVDIGADESDGRRWTAATRHILRVSTNGDDAHDGSSWPLAKRTVQAAINAAAVTGGDVWVASGVYAADDPRPFWGGIRLPAYVRLYGGFAGVESARDERDISAHPTILTNYTPGFIVTAVNGQRISRLDGFLLMGNPNAGGAAGVDCLGASPEIVNNLFTGLSSITSASLILGQLGFPLVDNNALVGNSGGRSGIMTFNDSTPTITRNLIRENVNPGPSLITAYDRSVIKDNLIAGNSGAATSAIFNIRGEGAVIAGNTIVGNSVPVFTRSLPIAAVANNIFQTNGSGAAPWPSGSEGGYLRNNCFYQSGMVARIVGKDGNIEAYPGFADLRTGDYRLRADSPCVDAGDDSVVTPGEVDLDGNPRIRGRHVDIGAFEFAGAASALPDVLEAMKIAAGLQAATPNSMDWLNPDKQSPGISLSDAVLLLKELKARADSME